MTARAPAPDARLNAGRKRRLIQRLDKALGRRSTPATANPAQRERQQRSQTRVRDARQSYDGLKRAILAEGGLRSNRDFPRSEIPADLYRPGKGKAPDVMAQVLQVAGYHYGGDDSMMVDIRRRRAALKDALGGRPGRVHNPQLICMDIERDAQGRFRRRRR